MDKHSAGTNVPEAYGWLGRPPDIAAGDIIESLQADIVVIGGGVAGVAAVREAAELGASVILFEKCSGLQARSGDFACVGSRIGERYGWGEINVNKLVGSLMKDFGYMVNQRILKTWAEECGDAVDWYLEGAEDYAILASGPDAPPEGAKKWIWPVHNPLPECWDNDKEYYPCYQATINFFPSHRDCLLKNFDIAREKGTVAAYFDTPAVKLLREEGGRVTGAIARKADGTYIMADARKGVILATGDYSGDHEMLRHFCPRIDPGRNNWTSFDRQGRPSNTGDGHKMAAWIGAKIQESPHAPISHHLGGPLGVAPYLHLNPDGERYMNEDCSGQQLNNQISLQRGRASWQIFDSGWKEQISFMPAGHACVNCFAEDGDKRNRRINPAYRCAASQEDVDEAARKGSVLSSDTLEGLIKLTGLPAAALKSIKRYNELAAKGFDEDFGKVGTRLFALENPPYYACKLSEVGVLCCLGGPESDHMSRCYDNERRVIRGLYLAGNVQGSRFAVEYPLTMPGLSHSMALTYGRIAARNAIQRFEN